MPEFKVKNYLRNMLNPQWGTKTITKKVILANIIIQIIGNIVSKKFSNYDTQFEGNTFGFPARVPARHKPFYVHTIPRSMHTYSYYL